MKDFDLSRPGNKHSINSEHNSRPMADGWLAVVI